MASVLVLKMEARREIRQENARLHGQVLQQNRQGCCLICCEPQQVQKALTQLPQFCMLAGGLHVYVTWTQHLGQASILPAVLRGKSADSGHCMRLPRLQRSPTFGSVACPLDALDQRLQAEHYPCCCCYEEEAPTCAGQQHSQIRTGQQHPHRDSTTA